MTVCVAALCDESTIVGASDRMLTAGDVQFEPQQSKVWWMTSSIAVMISGDTTLQTEVLLNVHAEVSQRIKDQPDNWWTVKDVAFLYIHHYNSIRARRAASAVLSPFGLTHDSFISRQGEMAPSFIAALTSDLLNFELPAVSAIIAGIDPTGAHLWLVSKSGRGIEASCHNSSGFVAIGIGRWHSQSQFMFAGHTRFRPFPETLLLTYSAKRRAEVAPGVGSGTDMFLVYGLGGSTYVGDEIINDLEKIYKTGKKKEQEATRRAGESAKQYVAKLFEEATPRKQGSLPEDGLIDIKLAKEYAGSPAGAVVRVDPQRAEWLRTHGYEEAPEREPGGGEK